MTPPMHGYAEQRAKAARWMFEHRVSTSHWWRSFVLTKQNPSPDSLDLHPDTAHLIFADFYQAGLLLPTTADDGYPAFSINLAKEREWKDAANPESAKWRAHGRSVFGHVVNSIVSLIVGAVLGWLWSMRT